VDEIVRYFREAVASPHSSPLEWWKANELNYPNLCNHAKQVLCIPASSVPSERVFSAAGLLINRLRCRLSSEHVDMLLFLYKSV
jgi:zinc finger BED domain-containing protein 1 (E3 SUMO-protein ligase ZBED1)